MNFDKTYLIQFTNKSTCNSEIQITYDDKHICTEIETKYLGLVINNNLSWKRHIECIKSKQSSACYIMQSLKPSVALNILKMNYSYFHSVMTYGLLFWGHYTERIKIFSNCVRVCILVWQTSWLKIFRLQKKILRIMMCCGSTDPCRKLFLI